MPKGIVGRFLTRQQTEMELLKSVEKRELEIKEHKLSYLFWEATLSCNYSCRHCGSDCSKAIDTSNELSAEEVLSVFRVVAQSYNPKKVMLAVTGGEPMMRPDLCHIMGRAAKMGFPWGMVTNGSMVDPKATRDLKKAGLRTVVVSIDGIEDDHIWLRGPKKSFVNAIRAVELFKAADYLKIIQITTTLTKRNINKLDEMYRLMGGLDIDEWRLLTVFPNGRAQFDKDLLLDAEEYKQIFEWISEKRKTPPKERLVPKLYYGEEGFLGHGWEHKVRGHWYVCRAGYAIAGILANGDISACPNLPREFVQGNTRKDNFIEVWNTKYQLFRDRGWMKTGECKTCSYWEYCQGNSLHLWDFAENRPKLCHVEMMGESRKKGMIGRIFGELKEKEIGAAG
jgi:radical SAM protein with 4Fe4S-binding SPASM domain